MTEQAIVVISEAHAASHMPAIPGIPGIPGIPDVPDAGTGSPPVTSVPDTGADIDVMAVDDMVEEPATTSPAHIRLSPSAMAPRSG